MSCLHRNNVSYQISNNNCAASPDLFLTRAATSRTGGRGLASTATAGSHALATSVGISPSVAARLVAAHCAGVGGLWLTAESAVGRRLFVVRSSRSIAAVVVVAGARTVVSVCIIPSVRAIVGVVIPGAILVAHVHVAVDIDRVAAFVHGVAAIAVAAVPGRLVVVGVVDPVVRVVAVVIVVRHRPVVVPVVRIVVVAIVAVKQPHPPP
jgi:hypothetical protein